MEAGSNDHDEEILFVYFKPSFMACLDLQGPADKIRRSLPSASCNSYEWMYTAAKARLTTMRMEQQEVERMAASLPGAAHPLTPGLTTEEKNKPKGQNGQG